MQGNNKNAKFLQFPIKLLRDIWGGSAEKEQAFDKIIDYGIAEFACRLPKVETAKAIIREYARGNPDFIEGESRGVYRKLQELAETEPLLSDHVEEIPAEEFEEYAEELAASFSAEELTVFGLPAARKYLEIEGGHPTKPYETWKRFRGGPMPMINKSLAFHFRDYSKTEFELAQLAGFIACKSIIGTGYFKKTNRQLITARMMGASSPKELKVSYLDKPARAIYDKYNKRYHFEKLMGYLEANWGLCYYSKKGVRGFYIGDANKISLEGMIKRVNEPSKIQKKQSQKQRLKAKYENS